MTKGLPFVFYLFPKALKPLHVCFGLFLIVFAPAAVGQQQGSDGPPSALSTKYDGTAAEIRGYVDLSSDLLRNNDPQGALRNLQQALTLAEDADDRDLIVTICSKMGLAYRELGVYQQATAFYLRALRLADRHTASDSATRAMLLNNLGTVYQRTGDFSDALENFHLALAINRARGDRRAVISNLLNAAVIHQKTKAFDSALAAYRTLLPLTRETGNRSLEGIITGNIGSALASQGHPEEGLRYLEQALVIKDEVNNLRSTLHTLNDIAEVSLQVGDLARAREAAERVVDWGRKYDIADQLRYGYLHLSQSLARAGDHPAAYKSLLQYKTLNDSLFNVEKAQQINELEIRYDTERKDMAIAALEQENKIVQAQRRVYVLAGALGIFIVTGLFLYQRQRTKRTRALLEKEREIDRMKSDFFANISHEFRTPLSLILGPLETLLQSTKGSAEKLQFELMKKSAARLLRLINQILELSRLQFTQQTLKASRHDAVVLIRGVTSTFQSLADTRGILLHFDGPDESLELYAEQEKIETICINLLSNAFKFSDTGELIAVRLSRVPASDGFPQGQLQLQVIDQGVGIPPEHLARIFDRFYRAGSSSEKQYGGTGIGLALTRELVELHHGTIDVASEHGRGTTVTVTLPLGREHLHEDQLVAPGPTVSPALPADLQPVAAPQPEAPASDAGEQPLVLVMDDNADIRLYIRSVLDSTYHVLEASNGEEGLGLARAFIPDLIISDVMMPVLDGYQTCRQLKRDEKTSHIPVIMLTAKASLSSRLEGLETEADLYLNKPFAPQELSLCIRNLIQSRRKLRERYNRQVVLKPRDVAINSTDEQFLQRLLQVMEENHANEEFGVEELSRAVGMSRSQLHRKLQALTNENTSQFIRSFRLQRAMEFLKKNHASVSEIAYRVGFSSPSYFNRCFQQHYNCTPTAVMGRETQA